MKYHWLAHHLVQEWFPRLDRELREEIVSEAICRAWCTFLTLDYRLMRSCVSAAAQRKGLARPAAYPGATPAELPETLAPASTPSLRAAVIRLSDYRPPGG